MSGDLLQGEDWGTAGNWSSSAIPVDGDIAIVSDQLAATATVTDSGGAAEGIDLTLLQTHPNFSGSFGTSAAPIRGIADLVQVYGGNFFFEADGESANKITDEVEVCAQTPGTIVELGSNPSDTGDLKDIRLCRGNVTIKGNSKLDAAARVVVARMTSDNDVRCTIANGAETLANLDVTSGYAEVDSIVTTINQTGGILVKDVTRAVNVFVFGGICFYDHQAVGGDATIVHVHAGAIFHMWRNAKLKTVTTVILHPDSTLVYNPNAHTITNLKNNGGKLITNHAMAQRVAAQALARR